jgi:inosine triphosphate pyrophosphatase
MMQLAHVVTLVTGNSHKLAEFKRLFPANFKFEIVDLDLPEIQNFDAREIVADKAKRAYAEVGKPVIVEDVSAGLDELNGLPGPFIKFFEQRMGDDALYQLAGKLAPATITSTIGYYDGSELVISKGVVRGSVMPPRGDSGFGFDCCFLPNGQTKTYAEMSKAEKDAMSHRALSVKAFLKQLKQL